MRTSLAALLALALLSLCGCASMGPGSIDRDRFDYNNTLNESWKRQVLLNVVKLRYVEPISFVDVGQIVAAYTLESGVSLSGTRTGYDRPGTMDNFAVNGQLSGKYTDRPTITYTPMTGKSFLQGVMLPIPAQNIMLHIQSGVSADIIMTLGVDALNGLRNEGVTTVGFRPAEKGFVRAVALIRALQLSGALRIKTDKVMGDQKALASLSFHTARASQETMDQIVELREILGLDPALENYRVVSGPWSGDRGVIAMSTLSIMRILASLSIRVDIPAQDVQAGRATPGLPEDILKKNPFSVKVRSQDFEPSGAFTAVRYRGHWFWVDDSDLNTKRIFSFILLAFTLLDDDKHDSKLQLTVPTQ